MVRNTRDVQSSNFEPDSSLDKENEEIHGFLSGGIEWGAAVWNILFICVTINVNLNKEILRKAVSLLNYILFVVYHDKMLQENAKNNFHCSGSLIRIKINIYWNVFDKIKYLR